MPEIKWKLHLKSPPEKVFEFLSTAEGRRQFWAETAEEENGFIHFRFINGQEYRSQILSSKPFEWYEIDYFDSVVRFELADDGNKGTDLALINQGVSPKEYMEVYAGWLSVLFALKGAVDFGIDLRNHDVNRSWDDGYVEN